MKNADVNGYLGCLKSSERDAIPHVIEFLTKAAVKAGTGETVSKNCKELIEKEEDGCDQNYGEDLKALTGVAENLTAGDLCPKTCSEALTGHYHDPNHPTGTRHVKVHGAKVRVMGRDDEPHGEVWHATGVITEPGKIDFDFSRKDPSNPKLKLLKATYKSHGPGSRASITFMIDGNTWTQQMNDSVGGHKHGGEDKHEHKNGGLHGHGHGQHHRHEHGHNHEHRHGGGHRNAGRHHHGASCADQVGLRKKLMHGKMEAADVKKYLGCLKSSGRDMHPRVVEFITQGAVKSGVGETVSKNCADLIENEEDGCDQNYGENLKGLTGVEGNLTAGDLCARTCSEDEGEESEEEDEEEGEVVQAKYLLHAALLEKASSTRSGAAASALLATALFLAGVGARLSRRRAASLEASMDDTLLESEVE